MKQVNDKFLIRDSGDNYYSTFRPRVIAKVGKDGQHFLYKLYGKEVEFTFDDPNLFFDIEKLKTYLEKVARQKETNAFIIHIDNFGAINIEYVKTIKEDNYDDILLLEPYDFNKMFESKSLDLKNSDTVVDLKNNIQGIFYNSIESVLNYFSENNLLCLNSETSLKVKFDNFLKRYKRENVFSLKMFKDYSGSFADIEFCIDNDLAIEDFEKWQAVQRVIKHKVDYKTASKIVSILYKQNIGIFDCE